MGELLIEFNIDAEVDIVKKKRCSLWENYQVRYEEYIDISKEFGPGHSENFSKFEEKVEDLNFDEEDV